MNGQQYSSSAVEYTYRAAAAVSSVWPSRGWAEGGTAVTVLGSGFSSAAEALGELWCRFNSTLSRAAYVSDGAAVCNTTQSGAGVVSVEVSNNGRDFSSGAAQYEFVSVLVSSLSPWSGPELGGTVVTVGGSGLGGEMEALRCRFGGVGTVWASVHGSTGVLCVSPASGSIGWVSVELLGETEVLESGSSFYVHARMLISAVAPSSGPVEGGTRLVVFGSSFVESATLRCRFEASGATTVARRLGSGQLECATPPSSSSRALPELPWACRRWTRRRRRSLRC